MTDIAIIVPTPEEWNVVVDVLLPNGEPVDETYPARRGTVATWEVLCVQCGKGTGRSAAAVSWILGAYKPRWVLLLGVAGGFPEEGVHRGDVVIGEFVYGYDFGKLEAGSFERRPDYDFSPDVKLCSWATTVGLASSRPWLNRISYNRPDGQPAAQTIVHVGYIASGDKVVDDPTHTFFSEVRSLVKRLHAVEMEGAGVSSAVRFHASGQPIGLLMIRGVSDEPGSESTGRHQRAEWKQYATAAVSALVQDVLQALAAAAHRAPAAAVGVPAVDAVNHVPRELSEPPPPNPFELVAADLLDLSASADINRLLSLFVTRRIDLPTISTRFNTVLEGQRGTGKTMILKYLSFETQVVDWTQRTRRVHSEYLSDPRNFIGVYIKIDQGIYDKPDYDLLPSAPAQIRLFEHRFALQLLYTILKTIHTVAIDAAISPAAERITCQIIRKILGLPTGSDDLAQTVAEASDHVDFSAIPEVERYLGSLSSMRPAAATPELRWLTVSGDVLPFLRAVRSKWNLSIPFYLLLDDFDVLSAAQQSAIFAVAAGRNFSDVCFKFGIMKLGKKTDVGAAGRTFRSGDDYDYIDLDWTAGGLHQEYQEAVRQIADARLREYGWPIELDTLLPAWPVAEQYRAEVRMTMSDEWSRAATKPSKTASEYISKVGEKRYFQLLQSRKVAHRYAGTTEVIMASSGIFRQFLETCKLIVDRANNAQWTAATAIRPEWQDDAIRAYSEQMISHFSKTFGDTQSLLAGQISVTSQHLINLIESLSWLFHYRLHDASNDPEIICVAVRDDLSQNVEARAFLDVAVRESILHQFLYPPKNPGKGPLPAYMLNRRLGPRRGLSIRRMQGRVELTTGDILMAIKEPARFEERMKRTAKQPVDDVIGTLFDIKGESLSE